MEQRFCMIQFEFEFEFVPLVGESAAATCPAEGLADSGDICSVSLAAPGGCVCIYILKIVVRPGGELAVGEKEGFSISR